MRRGLAGMALILGAAVAVAVGVDDAQLSSQWKEYLAEVPKTIVELQPFRKTRRVVFDQPVPDGPLAATLINLNPQVNAWFLLELEHAGAAGSIIYHLENPAPSGQQLSIRGDRSGGLVISAGGPDIECDLWRGGSAGALERARQTGLPYAPLCEDRIYLRNPVPGTYTHLERVTNFLRDHVWGGDRIVGFVKEQFFADAFVEKEVTGPVQAPERVLADGPPPARIAAAYADQRIVPEHLAIDVGQGRAGLLMGRWYAVRDSAGMFVSVVQPLATDPGDNQVLNGVDQVEGGALDYLVAMDLGRFDLGFALGTDHPRVGWSERVLDSMRNPRLPGPDGIGTVAPVVVDGMVSPPLVARTAATFAGGFKREHGAFRYGPLAQRNSGSHYGFIEQGVIFSKLQPDLATIFVTDDGTVSMKTWSKSDEQILPQIKHARQNGVPLVEYDPATRRSAPGALIASWGPGNWSGSSDERFRTLRSGACLIQTDVARYLVYGYFSTATPPAMARVFMAYGCRYAMHLDMNALEHTYFAAYTRKDGRIAVQHLIEGMAEVDRKGGGDEFAPRFLSFPDDRDFFYVTRKEPSAVISSRRIASAKTGAASSTISGPLE